MIEAPTSAGPILCFGEVLWDSLPQGLFPGGAPINVAYHLRQLGQRAIPVTAVGRDFLGDDLLRRLEAWGLETDHISVLPNKPTGVVQVKLDARGTPRYDILEDVAWDWIELPPGLDGVASGSAALVHGTLAQRSDFNRRQLARLMDLAPRAARVYDVNLRPPYDSPDLVMKLARQAHVIKLNDEELGTLLNRACPVDLLESAARELAAQTACAAICVTAGARGAGFLFEEKWHWAGSRPVEIKDTVGAGDAFLAALVNGLMTPNFDPAQTLQRACRLAEFVASCDGATPAYSLSPDGHPITPNG